jgi:hypothetical protein
MLKINCILHLDSPIRAEVNSKKPTKLILLGKLTNLFLFFLYASRPSKSWLMKATKKVLYFCTLIFYLHAWWSGQISQSIGNFRTSKSTKVHLLLGVTLERRTTRNNTTRWTAPSPRSRSFSDECGSGRRDAMSSLLCLLGRIMSRVPTNIRKKKPDTKILS